MVGDLKALAVAEEVDGVAGRGVASAYGMKSDFAFLAWMSAERPAVYGIVDQIDADRFAHALDQLAGGAARSVEFRVVVHVHYLDVGIFIEFFGRVHQQLSHHVHHAVRVCGNKDRDLACRGFKAGALLGIEARGTYNKSLFMSDACVEDFHAELDS